jgi:hypothetical protein
MTTQTAILAVEDKLSEAVSIRVLEEFGVDVTQCLGLRGKGYLQKKAQNFNQTAKGFPVFLLTDQDTPQICPPQLIKSWIKGDLNPKFFFRVAVMEVESWIMADRKGISDFFSIPLTRIPKDTDAILQPKEFLVSLARLSKKRSLREEIVPRPGATTKVGPGYNIRLEEFVRGHWHIERATSVSTSLQRTFARLRAFYA